MVLTDIDAARAAKGERAALRRIADGISREEAPGALFAQVAGRPARPVAAARHGRSTTLRARR